MVKNLPANAGDMGSIPGLGRSAEEGHDNPLLYSCLENLMDRRVWWATVHGVSKVRHNLETKKQQPSPVNLCHFFSCLLCNNNLNNLHGPHFSCSLLQPRRHGESSINP